MRSDLTGRTYSGKVVDLSNNPWRWVEDGIWNLRLTSRETAILRLRFGLWDGLPRTLEDIGDLFNLTRERVGQIVNKAIDRIDPEWRTNAFLRPGYMASRSSAERRQCP